MIYLQKMATRMCTVEGGWFVHPETNYTWTNYSQCFTTKTTRVIVRFPDLDSSSLVAVSGIPTYEYSSYQ